MFVWQAWLSLMVGVPSLYFFFYKGHVCLTVVDCCVAMLFF